MSNQSKTFWQNLSFATKIKIGAVAGMLGLVLLLCLCCLGGTDNATTYLDTLNSATSKNFYLMWEDETTDDIYAFNNDKRTQSTTCFYLVAKSDSKVTEINCVFDNTLKNVLVTITATAEVTKINSETLVEEIVTEEVVTTISVNGTELLLDLDCLILKGNTIKVELSSNGNLEYVLLELEDS